MAVGLPFTPLHVSSLAAYAEELERLVEDRQDPRAFNRAARLYKLAVRVTDDIQGRRSVTFTPGDLVRVRDELRTLATDAAAAGMLGDYGLTGHAPADTTGAIMRAFREIAIRIEQRIAADETRPRPRPNAEPRRDA